VGASILNQDFSAWRIGSLVEGVVHAAFVPGRAAFEVSLYIEWMFVSDIDKKATRYYVGNMRAERNWGLRRLSEYFLYYSKASQVTHSQTFKDQIEFKGKGVAAHPIRNVADVHRAFNLAFCTAIGVFNRVLGFYRNDELVTFWKMYVAEWRQAFTNIPIINIEGGGKPSH
jgi:hypothetical protein